MKPPPIAKPSATYTKYARAARTVTVVPIHPGVAIGALGGSSAVCGAAAAPAEVTFTREK